jgi:uncharacterized phage infection (PIP) family protein YhgE
LFFNAFSIGLNRFEEGSKTLQDASKRLQDAPRRLQDALRRSKTASRRLQDASKTLQDASKTLQDASMTLQNGPSCLQDASKTRKAAKIAENLQNIRRKRKFYATNSHPHSMTPYVSTQHILLRASIFCGIHLTSEIDSLQDAYIHVE